jgi:uncharacterized protein YihD (DUF1040 family)
MSHLTAADLPPPQWWNDNSLTLVGFLKKMAEYAEYQYDPQTIEFTHDVVYQGVVVGQAARVERLCNTLQLAVVSFFQSPAIYRAIDPPLELRPQRVI